MAASGGQSGRGAILVTIVVIGVALSPNAAAAAEDPTVVLPGTTITALTLDLDGDGDREIMRLVEEENGVDHAVDAWEHDSLRWSMIGSTPMPRTSEGRERGSDAVTLLLVTIEGRERVLALSAALVPDAVSEATCCMAISEVQLTADGRIDLRLIHRVDGGAQSIQAADVDGDGADDLVLHESQYGIVQGDETGTLTVLRWDGSGFEPAFESTDRRWLFGFSVGESDGVVGDDLLFGPSPEGMLHRLAWADGELRPEEGTIEGDGPQGDGWIVGLADAAIVLSVGAEVRVVRWARGDPPTTASQLSTPTYPGASLIGDGPDALVVVQSNLAFENGRPPTVTLHDLALRPLGDVGVSPATEDFWTLVSGAVARAGGTQRNVYPYVGPIYGGLGDARPAYVSSGILIQPGGPDGYEARPIAPLIGVQPIGLAGPQDAFAVIGDGYSAPPGAAYLYVGGVPPGYGRLAVTPLDHLLRPEPEVDLASVELLGAVEIARDGAEAIVMADGDGFRVAVTAPAGSAVIVVNGLRVNEHEVGDVPLFVDIAPLRSREEEINLEFEAMVLVITPDGRGTTAHWNGTFVREPPEISVTASTDAMALTATLAGRAGPGSTVSANGLAIETDDEGRFEASIDAPIWPSRVVVTARDPLGNEATELVEVVGVVDYRGLPWAAILIAATLLAGGVLYVRTPRRHAVASVPDGDGRLEELELDAIEGIEPGRR